MNFYRKKRSPRLLPLVFILFPFAIYLSISHVSSNGKSEILKPLIQMRSNKNESELGNVKSGTLFTVVVDHRSHCLARKITDNKYVVEYARKSPDIQIGSKVHTTGLDRQLTPDIFIGEITSIEHNPNHIYDDITILVDSC